ncbi:MAG: hypothetical protein QOD60_1587 [Solirubrobacterales bacterium]|jgi:hypothetical protein|nr:hypothetical protein [Solirubrobacterales bacterium]
MKLIVAPHSGHSGLEVETTSTRQTNPHWAQRDRGIKSLLLDPRLCFAPNPLLKIRRNPSYSARQARQAAESEASAAAIDENSGICEEALDEIEDRRRAPPRGT